MKSVLLLITFYSFTVLAQTPPYMTGSLINSCNGGCSEGDNELIFGNTGGHSVVGNSTNIQVFYGTTANPTDDYTSPLVTNTAKTTSLNSAAGCAPNLFLEGTGATMPPNSSFMIVRNSLCVSALTWSTLCGSGPIYIFYSTDPTWSASGNFSNGTGAANQRFFKTVIRNTSGTSFTTQYDYTLPAAFGNDGAFATWNSTGGSPTSYGDNDCSVNPVILPIELESFSGESEYNTVALNWVTSSETRTESFSVHHADAQMNFKSVVSIESRGTNSTGFEYEFIHDKPAYGDNYYSLYSKDLDQNEKLVATIVVHIKAEEAYYDNQSSELVLSDLDNYKLFSMDGRMLAQFGDCKRFTLNEHGFFLLVNTNSNQQQRIYIP